VCRRLEARQTLASLHGRSMQAAKTCGYVHAAWQWSCTALEGGGGRPRPLGGSAASPASLADEVLSCLCVGSTSPRIFSRVSSGSEARLMALIMRAGACRNGPSGLVAETHRQREAVGACPVARSAWKALGFSCVGALHAWQSMHAMQVSHSGLSLPRNLLPTAILTANAALVVSCEAPCRRPAVC